ncbi:hypothetical protein ACFQH1_01760 [Lactiplantibacillus daoliensis]|uniref:Uncharacterized protein n=1 Tax=Lactiplantibacillus daoliensis TaxID=2559916 RepID=A0ABW1UEW6_9LACO|nr:hypothetical protein [Lactiplantibacillus daoliensis]
MAKSSDSIIYRATPYGTILIILVSIGFTYFAIDSLIAVWGDPWFSIAADHVWEKGIGYTSLTVLEVEGLSWLGIGLFGVGGLFMIWQSALRFIKGRCQVLNINASGIALPMFTRNFARIPWQNVQKLTSNEDTIHITLVNPNMIWGPAVKKLDRGIDLTGNTLTVQLYQYTYWSGCDEAQLKRDLNRLSKHYIEA